MNVVSGSAIPLAISVSGDTPPDLTVTPVTLVLEAATRHVFRWRPPTSTDFSVASGVLYFDGLTSAWTAANLTRYGTYPLYVIYGESEDTQQAVGIVPLVVTIPPFGPLPVTG